MAIVTFWSDGKEQTGKTLSLAAISTYMAIEHNVKILVISTSTSDKTLQNCFIDKKYKNSNNKFFGNKTPNHAMQNGMGGLVRMARSNKVTPNMIKDYTSIVFNNALEILYSIDEKQQENTEDMSEYYPDIIKVANQYYDFVFVDLDTNINPQIQRTIMQDSDLIVANITQRISSVDRFMEERKNDELLASIKTLVLIGRYDKYSKYTSKNITRYIGEKMRIHTMPYNTLLYDAAEEAGLPDYFLNFVKTPNIDKENRNYLLVQEIKEIIEDLQYKLKEVQLNM